jgi:hypothetical protein
MGELGRMAGVAMPTVDAVVQLASALMGEDYRATGRTARLMGLTGLSLDAIRRRVREGPV